MAALLLRRRNVFGALLVLASSSAARAADQPRLELQFRAPAECGTAAEVHLAVRSLVQRQGPRLSAAIDIVRQGDVYVAVVRTDPSSERRLTARDCAAAVEAASVVLALALDPDAGSPALRPSATPRVPPAPPSLQPALAAALTVDSATLPHVAFGGSLSAGLVAARGSGWLKLTAWYPREATLGTVPPRGGRFVWWTAALSLCLAPTKHRWATVCVSPELGRLAGTGTGAGVPRQRTASATWLALGVGPALEWLVTARWALRLDAGAAATLLGRHPFILEVDDAATLVHQPARLSARASLGLAARF